MISSQATGVCSIWTTEIGCSDKDWSYVYSHVPLGETCDVLEELEPRCVCVCLLVVTKRQTCMKYHLSVLYYWLQV